LVLPICPGPENFGGDTHKPYAAISEKKNDHIKKGLNETEVSNYFGHCGKEVVEGSGAGGAFPGGDLGGHQGRNIFIHRRGGWSHM
jgi:hypothetical protein